MSLAKNYFDLDSAAIELVELDDTKDEDLLNAKIAEMVVSEYKPLECFACDKHFGYQYRKDPDTLLCNNYNECVPLVMKSLREKDVSLKSSVQPVLMNRDGDLQATCRRNAMTPLSPMPAPGFWTNDNNDDVSIDSQKRPDEGLYSGSSAGVMTRSHCVPDLQLAVGTEMGWKSRGVIGKSWSHQQSKDSLCQDMRDMNNNPSGM